MKNNNIKKVQELVLVGKILKIIFPIQKAFLKEIIEQICNQIKNKTKYNRDGL